jgi:molybdate-binding protein
LAEERFDLAIPQSTLSDARVERLLDALASLEFRRELAALGYDTRQTGQRVGEVRAA